jgi:CheY-like chemotaxis protein
MFAHDATAELWSDAKVKCVLVPHGDLVEVELRNAAGSAFLRKLAPTRQAALNEAEYLRLLLHSAGRSSANRGLKPFALVLEADPNDPDALSAALRLSGIRALTCRSGAEGISLACDLVPDLIAVDASVQDLTGGEICRRLRESDETSSTPIIAVTPWPEALRAEGCQADAVLTRPCEVETFLASARHFVRHLLSTPDPVS